MDDKLREILLNFDELDYGAPDDGPLKDAIAQIKQVFSESFKEAYIKYYNLENQALSANDEAIFKIVEEL